MVVRNVREDEGRAGRDLFDALRQGAQGTTAVTVRILPANDHDGVCAARILVSVLQVAGIKYVVVPVAGNAEIIEHLQQLEDDAEVRSLILLNCGSMLDLQQHLEECAAPQGLRCHVIDAHRPFLLANLSKRSDRVTVYDDNPRAEEGGTFVVPPPGDEDWEDEGSASSHGGDSVGEEEHVFADGPGGRPARASALERLELKQKRRQELEARREEKRRRVVEYYLSTYHATPVAVSLFKMARQSTPTSLDQLWAAAVAAVGYYEQGLMGKLEYDRLVWEELKEALDRADDFGLSTDLPSTAESSAAAAAAAASDDEGRPPPPTRRRISAMASASRRLRFEAVVRLLLYKHWTLEESMMHSSYFYGTLELHRDKGLRALKNYLVTAGIRPKDYKQLYSGLPLPIRKTLETQLSKVGKAYGLSKDRMFLNQFVRDLGPLGEAKHALWLHSISSSDAVHIVTALLSNVPASLSSGRLAHLPQTEGGRRDMFAINEMEREAMKENFWRAFDAVLCKDPAPLRKGIEDAAKVAEEVQKMGHFIKDTKAMHNHRLFRWCKIEQPPHIFRHYLAVRRLAVWLLDVLFTYRPKGEGQDKPLLVIVHDHVRETYLCVGATPNRLSDDRDEFGYLFRTVLRADRNLTTRYDFFDRSCIEVAADDFERFWDLLTDSA